MDPFDVFLTTVHCKWHHLLLSECACSLDQWYPVFEQAEAAVSAIRAATGCSAAEAWAQWLDDTASQASTSSSTIGYGDAADTED